MTQETIPSAIGKIGTFAFSTHPDITGTILHVPQATGDCWIIKTVLDEFLYIQQFDYMAIHQETPDEDPNGF